MIRGLRTVHQLSVAVDGTSRLKSREGSAEGQSAETPGGAEASELVSCALSQASQPTSGTPPVPSPLQIVTNRLGGHSGCRLLSYVLGCDSSRWKWTM